MSTVVKLAFGIFFGGLLLVAGCWACVGTALTSAAIDSDERALADVSYADSVSVSTVEVERGSDLFGEAHATVVVENRSAVALDIAVSFDLFEPGAIKARTTPSRRSVPRSHGGSRTRARRGRPRGRGQMSSWGRPG